MSFPAILAFEDGSVFQGEGFGKEKYDIGEIVFNTSMSGYQEIITDPSYKKQIITFTHPHIGNTGINNDDNESKKIHASGIVVRNYCEKPSNWRSSMTLNDFLIKNDWIIQTLGKDAGPSKNYINPEFKGKFGVIAPYSKDFCKSCNRLRITSRGDLRLCLFGNTGISIRHLMQKDEQLEELKDLILNQLNYKKESHYLEIGETGLNKNLSTIGG